MTPLIQKLQMKPGKRWLIYNPPAGYLASLKPLPEGTTCTSKSTGAPKPTGKYDGIQLFATNKAQLSTALRDIHRLLQHNPPASRFYEQLSYSSKKEYVLWILTAKQEKTRADRLARMAEKLTAGKKNPAEK